MGDIYSKFLNSKMIHELAIDPPILLYGEGEKKKKCGAIPGSSFWNTRCMSFTSPRGMGNVNILKKGVVICTY